MYRTTTCLALSLFAAHVLGAAPRAQTLDETWTVTVGGQTAQVQPDGTFRIANVAAPDNFGVGGPGTPPDFVSDDFLMMTGISTAGGVTRYAFSEHFQITEDQRYVIENITITPNPPPLPVSISMSVAQSVLTSQGETTGLTVLGTLGDGSVVDLSRRDDWTIYRTSNPFVASVGPDGLVQAVGPGIAYLTAVNDGATAVTRVVVSLVGLTTVEGRVLDSEGVPVGGASVSVFGVSSGLSDLDGRFRVLDVPAGLGNVVAFASADAGNGASISVAPVPSGITDVGDIRLLPSSVGSDFMTCFPPNLGSSSLRLFISGDVLASGTVEIPGIGFNQAFTVEPGLVTSVSIPIGAVVTHSDSVVNRGVFVSADAPINVYGLNQATFTTDGFTALPVDAAGTRHRVLSYTAPPNGTSQFAVVGIADGTTVTITPSADVPGHPAGQPYEVLLDRFDVYQLRSGSADLTGTLVESDRGVSLVSGHSCANVPSDSFACDHLVEQVPPVAFWSTEYLTVDLASRVRDTFRILADEDNTVVTITGATGQVLNLNAGEFAELILEEGGHRIAANQPILVAQYSNGTTFDNRLGDPFVSVVAPSVRYRASYTFTTPSTGFATHYVNAIIQSGDLGSLLLDGVPVLPLDVIPIGASGTVGVQLQISAGCHTLSAPNPLGLLVYGFNNADSYGYTGGL